MVIICPFVCNLKYITTDVTIPIVIYVSFYMNLFLSLFNLNEENFHITEPVDFTLYGW